MCDSIKSNTREVKLSYGKMVMLSIDFGKLLSSECYLFALISAFIIGNIIKQQGYFLQIYTWVVNGYGNNKIVLFFLSILCGILPIEGRSTISAPLMDSVVNQEHSSRQKMGIINYIASHHYYFWSPIEPSVLIFLTALGISWSTFLTYTWPLLSVYLLFFISLLYFYVEPTDLTVQKYDNYRWSKYRQSIFCCVILLLTISITVILEVVYKFESPLKWTLIVPTGFLLIMTKTSFNDAIKLVDWKTIFVVALLIAFGCYIKQYGDMLQHIIQSEPNTFIMMMIGFVSAFVLGSSSKYAGIGSIIVLAIGNINWLPFVLAVEYSGYLLSPTHKCLSISKLYFNTNTQYLLGILLVLCVLLVTTAGLTVSYLLIYGN